MRPAFRPPLSSAAPLPSNPIALALIAVLSLTASAPTRAEGALPDVAARESGWQHYGTSDEGESDYVMYTRKPAGSDYSAYRLEAIFDAPVEVVADVAARNIVDPAFSQKNMDKTVLERDAQGALIHSHIHINAPFISDRDVVTRVEFDFDPTSKTHVVRWRATDEGPPPPDGVIRLDRSDGSWTFLPSPDGKTRAIYTSHTEIAGALPAWLLNGFMSNTMVESVTGLREALQRELASR